MGILEALISGFMQATSLEVFPYLLAGSMFGLILGVIPGLGGHFAMAMVIPFLYTLSPSAGIAFLLGSHATVAQGGGLTAILFSTPGCGQNAATLLDGPAMRSNGLAGKAAGAAMTSCFLGAAFGVIVLAFLIPVLQKLVLVFGPAEICVLVFLALTFVSVLGKEDISRSLIAGLSGLLLAMVGLENFTNQERFTFELMALRDGLPLVPVILGLFAAAEMIDLWVEDDTLSGKRNRRLSSKETQTQIFEGVAAAFKHWWLVLRCSSIGTFMGLIPGLGSTTASFVAYGHAKQTSNNSETFGKGNIEGVIAAESANDAVEGGALASTIAFGIPGSSSMAIVLAGLFILGVQTGPVIVTHHTDLIFVMIFTVIIGNLFGTIAGMFLVNPLARLTALPSSLLVPVLLAIIFTGAYAVNSSTFDIGIVVLFGFLGYLMKKFGYSRSSMLIGFVLGAVLEKNLFLAVQLDGAYFFLQPIPLGLGIITVGFLAYNIWSIFRAYTQTRANQIVAGQKVPANVTDAGSNLRGVCLETYLIAFAGLIFLAALVTAFGYRAIPARTPIFILIPLLLLTVLQIIRSIRAANSGADSADGGAVTAADMHLLKAMKLVGWTVLLLLLIILAGHYAGVALFMFILLKFVAGKETLFSLAVTAVVTCILFFLFELGFGIELYRGLIFRGLSGYQLT
jgi:putative tricarboxylic transport membrane protein